MILIVLAYHQLQQLQPRFIFGDCKHPKTIQSLPGALWKKKTGTTSLLAESLSKTSGAHQEPAQPDGNQLGEHQSGSGPSEHLGSRTWSGKSTGKSLCFGAKKSKDMWNAGVSCSFFPETNLLVGSSASMLLGGMVLWNKLKDHQPKKEWVKPQLSNSGKYRDLIWFTDKV